MLPFARDPAHNSLHRAQTVWDEKSRAVFLFDDALSYPTTKHNTTNGGCIVRVWRSLDLGAHWTSVENLTSAGSRSLHSSFATLPVALALCRSLCRSLCVSLSLFLSLSLCLFVSLFHTYLVRKRCHWQRAGDWHSTAGRQALAGAARGVQLSQEQRRSVCLSVCLSVSLSSSPSLSLSLSQEQRRSVSLFLSLSLSLSLPLSLPLTRATQGRTRFGA